MEISEMTEFSRNLAGIAETLQFVLPLAAGIAGTFGLASMVFFSFVRKH